MAFGAFTNVLVRMLNRFHERVFAQESARGKARRRSGDSFFSTGCWERSRSSPLDFWAPLSEWR